MTRNLEVGSLEAGPLMWLVRGGHLALSNWSYIGNAGRESAVWAKIGEADNYKVLATEVSCYRGYIWLPGLGATDCGSGF